ncbi:MAG: TetR/AcrR family transcriptional regulator [Caulobacter sp.]|nr:TetR/AcrR family transcriptional regulator [Caulobacter sp.]
MPKLVDHDVQRRTIAEAAIRVIDRVGLDAARLRDVALEGQVTTGAVTHYFASKDDVLEAAMAEVVRRILDRQADQALGREPVPSLIEAAAAFLPLDEERLRDWRVWFAFWGRAAVDARYRALHRSYYADITVSLTRSLTQLRDAGRLRDRADPAILADAVIAAVDGIGVRATHEPDNWPPARQVATLRLLLEPILSPD